MANRNDVINGLADFSKPISQWMAHPHTQFNKAVWSSSIMLHVNAEHQFDTNLEG